MISGRWVRESNVPRQNTEGAPPHLEKSGSMGKISGSMGKRRIRGAAIVCRDDKR